MWPPREAAVALHRWAIEAQRASGGRVTRLETIHLTLAFLGDAEESALHLLKGLNVRGERHFLPIEQARYWAHNRIVWAGPERTPEALRRLSGDLNQELKSRQFRTEAREFAAHVTLIRNAHAPNALPALPTVRWSVEEYLLVESVAAGKGRDYEVLARYALA
ncbi:MAG: RNA 2',3'-cyclic phosphodiesterase [Burkholderiales bacterium]